MYLRCYDSPIPPHAQRSNLLRTRIRATSANAGGPEKKGPTEMGPFTFNDAATLVVVRIFELRQCLELFLVAAHHGMVGSPVIRTCIIRACSRGRGGVGRRRGCAGGGFAR